MDRTLFESNFVKAVDSCIQFANQLVTQDLSRTEVEFRLYPNQSYDGNATDAEQVFPDETLPVSWAERIGVQLLSALFVW